MTFLDKFKLEHLSIVSQNTDSEGCIHYVFGCPRTYGYEETLRCPNNAATTCEYCWNREIPEKKAEEPIELNLNLKEEKKMRNLSDVIRDAVLNAINDSDIEYAVKECFENHDYSDMIGRAVENYLYENIEDIADDIVEETVRDYMRDNL